MIHVCVDQLIHPPLAQHPGFVHLIRESLISAEKKTLFLETTVHVLETILKFIHSCLGINKLDVGG